MYDTMSNAREEELEGRRYAFYDGRWLLVVKERLAGSDTAQLIIA